MAHDDTHVLVLQALRAASKGGKHAQHAWRVSTQLGGSTHHVEPASEGAAAGAPTRHGRQERLRGDAYTGSGAMAAPANRVSSPGPALASTYAKTEGT